MIRNWLGFERVLASRASFERMYCSKAAEVSADGSAALSGCAETMRSETSARDTAGEVGRRETAVIFMGKVCASDRKTAMT